MIMHTYTVYVYDIPLESYDFAEYPKNNSIEFKSELNLIFISYLEI